MTAPASTTELPPWPAGAWFGSTLGGSLWMLLGGLMMLRHDVMVAIIVLGLFMAINAIAMALWARRATLPPLLSMQFIVVLIGIASFIAVFLIDRSGYWLAIQIGSKVPAVAVYVGLGLGIPLIVGLLWVRRWIHSLPSTADE